VLFNADFPLEALLQIVSMGDDLLHGRSSPLVLIFARCALTLLIAARKNVTPHSKGEVLIILDRHWDAAFPHSVHLPIIDDHHHLGLGFEVRVF
jgi:hypothetical protein